MKIQSVGPAVPISVADPGTGLETELERLGFLPTPEYPVLWRALGKSGYGIFLILEQALDSQTLRRLADCSDLTALIRRAAACDPPDKEGTV